MMCHSLLFNCQQPECGWLKNTANPAANLTRAGVGRICQKQPDIELAEAEIQYIPSIYSTFRRFISRHTKACALSHLTNNHMQFKIE